MQIKYNKKKKELRRDPVIETLLAARDFIRSNSNSILSILILALLVAVGFSAYSYVKRSGQKRAEEAFGKAMIAYEGSDRSEAVEALSLVADKHAGVPQAAYAAFMVGHLYLSEGSFDEAATWFEVASQHKKAGFIAGEALEGLALSYEAKGDIDKAIEYLHRALKRKDLTYRSPSLRWKLALLNRQRGHNDRARQYCEAIVSDTLATELHQKAQNLLVEIEVL